MSVRSSWFTVLFKSSISTLIFSVVSIIESGVLTFPTLIVELSVSLNSFNFCFLYFVGSNVRCLYVYNCYVFLVS